jgi:hypothetical protein
MQWGRGSDLQNHIPTFASVSPPLYASTRDCNRIWSLCLSRGPPQTSLVLMRSRLGRANICGSAGKDSASKGRCFTGYEKRDLAANCQSEKFKLIIYDTETTGTWPQRVVELAAYAPESGEKFETLVKCPKGIEVRVLLFGSGKDISDPAILTTSQAITPVVQRVGARGGGARCILTRHSYDLVI